MRKYLVIILTLFSACSKGGGPPSIFDLSVPDTPFTIRDPSQLIGGPLATGMLGDVLLSNDRIKVIIERPIKYPASCPFGGVIIDADIARPDDTPGQDNFGKMCPLVNVEWTINYYDYKVVSDGSDGGPKILRAYGRIDVNDYLDLDFIGPVARALTGQALYFSPRFDDVNDPFSVYEDLRGLSNEVVTEYRLDPGKNYVRIDTTIENRGDQPVSLPVGQFINGSGQVQLLIPGLGFSPSPLTQVNGNTPAVIYIPFEGVDVSYGYFYDLGQFLNASSLTYSGVTGLILGEEFLSVLPMGGPSDVDIKFTIPPNDKRRITEYFVVGDGSGSSVLTYGLEALGIGTRLIDGRVVDAKGSPASGATLVVQDENDVTIITHRTGEDGSFSLRLPSGEDSWALGKGRYKLFAEKRGYHAEGTGRAGTCTPDTIDLRSSDALGIVCRLGASGVVELSGGVTDENGVNIPARLTIVGFDPSPSTGLGAGPSTSLGAGPSTGLGAGPSTGTKGEGRWTKGEGRRTTASLGRLTHRPSPLAPRPSSIVAMGPKAILGNCGLGIADCGLNKSETRNPQFAIRNPQSAISSEPQDPLASRAGGAFEDSWMVERAWGVVDVKYVNANGGFWLGDETSFRLEPGHYALVFSRGVEYGIDLREIDVADGATVPIEGVRLRRVVQTPGWISADFHLHAIPSPDSAIPLERRVIAAAGEGMDVLQSSDHDWLTDYGPPLAELEGLGVVGLGEMTTIIGDEISPNSYGHMHAFPLRSDPDSVTHGALDWTSSPLDEIGFAPDYVMSPQEVFDHFKSEPGEYVLQINHIADRATSLLVISSWVTSGAYLESHHVTPLSSYVEEADQRVSPTAPVDSFPIPFGKDSLVSDDFTALELTIGPELHYNLLKESALPQWFNLLNLGLIVTATGDSDSHRETVDQLGLPRNYIAYHADPRDGIGDWSGLDKDTYANAINEHRVVVTTGPFIEMNATSQSGQTAGIGDTLSVASGEEVTLHIDVRSPDWAWFDTVEVYMNTEPVPAQDDGTSPLTGVASDPKTFFAPYHVPRYQYEPWARHSLSDGSLKNWKEKDGLITASINVPVEVKEDSWIMVFVSGTKGTEGWRSLFPFVANALDDPSRPPATPKGWKLDDLARSEAMAASAWAFTNPIFIDVDGDTNGDGELFEARSLHLYKSHDFAY